MTSSKASKHNGVYVPKFKEENKRRIKLTLNDINKQEQRAAERTSR